jgi:hypothetical protein
MALIDGEGRVQILYGRTVLPSPPHRSVYLSRPDVVGRHPAAVVIHDENGQTPSVRALCRRLARYGYVAAAPDLARGDGIELSPDRVADDAVRIAETMQHGWSAFCRPESPALVAIGGSAVAGAGAAADIGGPLVILGGPVTDLETVLGAVRGPILGIIAAEPDGESEAVRALHGSVGRGEWAVFPTTASALLDEDGDDFDYAAFEDMADRLVAFLDRYSVLAPA